MLFFKQSVLRTLVPKLTPRFIKRTAHNFVLVLIVLKRIPASLGYNYLAEVHLSITAYGWGEGGGSVLGKNTVFTRHAICKI